MRNVHSYVLLLAVSHTVAFANDYTKENIATTKGDTEILVSAKYSMNKAASCDGVIYALDEKLDTSWCTKQQEKDYYLASPRIPSLQIDFRDDIYLTSIALASGCENGGFIRSIIVEPLLGNELVWELGSPQTLKNETRPQQVYKPDDRPKFFQLFPVKSIQFDILSTHDRDDAEVCVRDVDLTFNKSSTYKPRRSAEFVKEYIYGRSNAKKKLAEDSLWTFNESGNHKTETNDEIFADLTYYAMLGDKDCRKLFFSANPYNEGKLGVMNDLYKPAMKEFLEKKGFEVGSYPLE